jgi:FixJ family two-component response regulator
LAFSSAEEFLSSGRAADSACIVSDIQMPGLSGIHLTRRLTDDGCRAPVILITALTAPETQERALASGALCVLCKPFTADVFLESLGRALAG